MSRADVSLARPGSGGESSSDPGADSLSALHGQLASCDGILATMESMLTHFQADLSAISGEIQSLQEKSYGMFVHTAAHAARLCLLPSFRSRADAFSLALVLFVSSLRGVKLRNYKSAERTLHDFVSRAYIPDDLANVVLEGGMDEAFVVALQELDGKLTFLEEQKREAEAKEGRASGQSRRGSRSGAGTPTNGGGGGGGSIYPSSMPLAARDMAPLGEKLRIRSVARIRAFLLERFHSLKKPKTNIQIKQKMLLKFAPVYQFLLHHADVGTGTGAAAGGGMHERAPSSRTLMAPSTPSSGGGNGSSLPPLGPSGSGSASASAAAAAAAVGVDICSEVRREYHETLSTIYASKFKKYLGEISKLAAENGVRKSDTLGNDEGGNGGGGSDAGKEAGGGGMGGMLSGLWGGKKSASAIDHVFRLGNRDEVLATGALDGSASATLGLGTGGGGAGASGDGDLLVPHLASSSGSKLPFERLFKASTALLMDTATSEYDFIVEFFGERMRREMDRAGMHEEAIAAEKEAAAAAAASAASGKASPAPATPSSSSSSSSSSSRVALEERGRSQLLSGSRVDKDLFKLVFSKSVSLFLEFLDTHLHSCHDALGVLLLIRVVCQHNISMQYRRVHCLDHMFDRMNMTLWPKFKSIFDANVESVINLKAQTVRQEGRKVHALCTRYADFAAGILRLNHGYADPILTANLGRLSGEVNKFLLRSAALAPSPRTQLVYLLNSYQAILHVLSAGGSTANGSSGAGSAAGAVGTNAASASSSQQPLSHRGSEEYRYWEEQSKSQVALYVELELQDKLGSVIAALKGAEAKTRAGAAAGAQGQSGARTATAPQLSVEERRQVRAQVVSAAVEFERIWRDGIRRLHEGIHANFAHDAADTVPTSSKAGGAGSNASASAASSGSAASSRELFMQVLSQLLLYHERLDRLLKSTASDAEGGPKPRLPSRTDITAEIRKYTKE